MRDHRFDETPLVNTESCPRCHLLPVTDESESEPTDIDDRPKPSLASPLIGRVCEITVLVV